MPFRPTPEQALDGLPQLISAVGQAWALTPGQVWPWPRWVAQFSEAQVGLLALLVGRGWLGQVSRQLTGVTHNQRATLLTRHLDGLVERPAYRRRYLQAARTACPEPSPIYQHPEHRVAVRLIARELAVTAWDLAGHGNYADLPVGRAALIRHLQALGLPMTEIARLIRRDRLTVTHHARPVTGQTEAAALGRELDRFLARYRAHRARRKDADPDRDPSRPLPARPDPVRRAG